MIKFGVKQIFIFTYLGDRNRITSIATRYGLDGPGIKSPRKRDFPHLSRPALGPTRSPVQRTPCHFNWGKAAGSKI